MEDLRRSTYQYIAAEAPAHRPREYTTKAYFGEDYLGSAWS